MRSRSYRIGAGWDNDQRVGAHQGRQSGRCLLSSGRCLQMTFRVDASNGPLKFDAIGRPHAVIEPHPGTRAVNHRRPEHGPQRRSDEDLETDQCRYRIAGQTEYQGFA